MYTLYSCESAYRSLCRWSHYHLPPPRRLSLSYPSFLPSTSSVKHTPNREPEGLLDRDRFRRPSRVLSEEEEARLDDILQRIVATCERRGVLVKPFFEDAARSKNSSCLVGHVTVKQFLQVREPLASVRPLEAPSWCSFASSKAISLL
jgi:hypothetical protein